MQESSSNTSLKWEEFTDDVHKAISVGDKKNKRRKAIYIVWLSTVVIGASILFYIIAKQKSDLEKKIDNEQTIRENAVSSARKAIQFASIAAFKSIDSLTNVLTLEKLQKDILFQQMKKRLDSSIKTRIDTLKFNSEISHINKTLNLKSDKESFNDTINFLNLRITQLNDRIEKKIDSLLFRTLFNPLNDSIKVHSSRFSTKADVSSMAKFVIADTLKKYATLDSLRKTRDSLLKKINTKTDFIQLKVKIDSLGHNVQDSLKSLRKATSF